MPIEAVRTNEGDPKSQDRGAGSRKVLSILVPVCNEEENLRPFFERLHRVLESLPQYQAEIICIDDGSRDNSYAVLRHLRERDPRIKILKLSRNFGSWMVVAAGFHVASGDAVTWLASDLQDPPEVLSQLVSRWATGANVVWAVRTQRDDPWSRRLLAALFYRIVRRIAVPEYPPMGTDICLMDRKVARIFAQLKERNRFTQALIMNLGFTQVTVPYKRERRQHGRSKWGNLSRLAKIGTDMIVGTTDFPFRAMLYAGTIMLTSGLLLAAALLVDRAGGGGPVAVWVPVALVALVMGGLNICMLGILGAYLWRVLEEVRGRPLYVVEERIGFDQDISPARALEQPHEMVGFRE